MQNLPGKEVGQISGLCFKYRADVMGERLKTRFKGKA